VIRGGAVHIALRSVGLRGGCGLQTVQEVRRALRMGRGGEDRPLSSFNTLINREVAIM